MEPAFNGLGMGLGNLAELSQAETRSISAENFTGEKGGRYGRNRHRCSGRASWAADGKFPPASIFPVVRP